MHNSGIKINSLLCAVALAALGCGAQDMAPDRGSLFDYDDALVGDYGQARQAWTSAEYHGRSDGGPCYNSGSQGRLCYFPKFKQMRMLTNTGTLTCEDNAQFILGDGGTRAQFNTIFQGVIDGILSVNGIGSGVVVNTSGAGTHFDLTLQCFHDAAALGRTDYHGTVDTGTNLAPFPGGHDPGDGAQYSSADLNISAENIWWKAHDVCGDANNITLYVLGRETGAHETLHAMGFDHFASGLMRPQVQCGQFESSADYNIPAVFGTALGDYTGGGSPTTPPDVGLSSQGIPSGKI